MKTIVTHGANFHSDDLFATAALMLLLKKIAPKEVVKLVRSQTFDEKTWKNADFVYDIGRVYDPAKNRFDHHQEGGAGVRENGIPYAAFGLVWKKFGKKIAGSQEVADYVDRKLVQPIDAGDNGVELYTPKFESVGPFVIQDYAYMKSNQAKDEFEKNGKLSVFDAPFKKLLPLVQDIILSMIARGSYKETMRKKAKKLIEKTTDKRIVIMDSYIGFDFSEFPEPLVTVYRDLRTKGNWAAKTIKKTDRNDFFEARMYFPKEWAGKGGEELAKITGVTDAYFCHNARFLVVAKSKEGILALVKKALEYSI
ncbi:MAG: MYG1 family protein [Patescibacteria group bacterium]